MEEILQQLKTVVSIPLFMGDQPSEIGDAGFRDHPQYHEADWNMNGISMEYEGDRNMDSPPKRW